MLPEYSNILEVDFWEHFKKNLYEHVVSKASF